MVEQTITRDAGGRFQRGSVANPNGRPPKPPDLWRAIRRRVRAVDADRIADALIERAADGDAGCVQLVADALRAEQGRNTRGA